MSDYTLELEDAATLLSEHCKWNACETCIFRDNTVQSMCHLISLRPSMWKLDEIFNKEDKNE